MHALKEAQRVIEKQYGIQLEDFENAYIAENALSSVNQAEWERYIKDYYEPMTQIIDKWIHERQRKFSVEYGLLIHKNLLNLHQR